MQTERKLDRVRASMAGCSERLLTPFGKRALIYADYTASGRSNDLVERQIARLSAVYANPHTTDSATGRASGRWLREAEAAIKEHVNADPSDCIIACGSGATAAIHKLQEILGISMPPHSRTRIASGIAPHLGPRGGDVFESILQAERPVVFIGPYEHHSNELSWREGLAEVVPIGLTDDGLIDLAHLQRELCNPLYAGRQRIGAFSAASNVTGVKTDIPAVARLLHAHGAILCLDCAASAPYQRIDMHPAGDPEARIDAVCFSPHKFVGGPGACGVLVFNRTLYRSDLPPTLSAGGTVRYVWNEGHDFIEDVEARERAGTPGVPQIARAALALKLQSDIGIEEIEAREQAALERAFAVWSKNPAIDILGPQVASERIGIVSFNVRDPRGQILHPRFVTVLLNDLFGIQTRAGCSCAGPYGHYLLDIDAETTRRVRSVVLDGYSGMRPGWCRVGLHWVLTDEELDYLIKAIDFVGREGWRFLESYSFDPKTGAWNWAGEVPGDCEGFPETLFAETVAETEYSPASRDELDSWLAAAEDCAHALTADEPAQCGRLCERLDPVRYFTVPSGSLGDEIRIVEEEKVDQSA